ncbi:MAG: SHOCT domain-containing protein [Pseudomonadota bacterium]
MAKEGSSRGSGRPLSVVRAEVLADPETKQIADLLGLELEEYADMVMGYVENPDKDPELYVVDEAKLAEEGFELDVPSVEEMTEWLQAVERGEISLSPEEVKSRFASVEAAARRKARIAAGKVEADLAPWMGEEGSGLIHTSKDEKGRLITKQIQAEATKARTKAAPGHGMAAPDENDEVDDDEQEDAEVEAREERGADSAGGSLTQRLQQLKEAYDAGLLTRAEFAKKKNKLLSEL